MDIKMLFADLHWYLGVTFFAAASNWPNPRDPLSLNQVANTLSQAHLHFRNELIPVHLKMTPLRTEWAHCRAEPPSVSDCKWKAKNPVRQRALSSCWAGEEKPLAARLSGVEVSLWSAIKCLPLSPMNHRITGETVHCCLKASVPLIHVSPPAQIFSPLHTLVINTGSAPLLLASLLLCLCQGLSTLLCLLTYFWSFCLSHDVCPLLEWPIFLMDHGLQRHIDTHWTNLCANGQALIKGIN